MADRPDLAGYRKPTVPTVPELVERDPVDPPNLADRAADEPDQQFNVRITAQHRRMVEDLVRAHPYGRRATRRDVVEEAIEAAHSARFREPPVR